MGGQPEKLLTLGEAARRLGVPADDVQNLVRSGKLHAFRLGGNLLRVRSADVENIRQELVQRSAGGRGSHKPIRVVRRKESVPAAPASAQDRLMDFFYFNDFYLVAILAILILLAVIFAL